MTRNPSESLTPGSPPPSEFGDALNALNFQCAQHDSLSELFISEKMHCTQCEGKSLRDSDKL